MRPLPHGRAPHSIALSATILQPPLQDGTLLVPVIDSADSIHAEHPPEQVFNRHREAVILDRLFWTTIGVLMAVGVGLRIWVLL